MKKRTWVIVLLVVLTMMCNSMIANAATATVGGVSVTYYSKINSGTASAGTTSADSNLKATVSSTYTYYNTKTLATGSKTSNGSASGGVIVTFTVPSGCESASIFSNHTAKYGNYSWSGSSNASY